MRCGHIEYGLVTARESSKCFYDYRSFYGNKYCDTCIRTLLFSQGHSNAGAGVGNFLTWSGLSFSKSGRFGSGLLPKSKGRIEKVEIF